MKKTLLWTIAFLLMAFLIMAQPAVSEETDPPGGEKTPGSEVAPSSDPAVEKAPDQTTAHTPEKTDAHAPDSAPGKKIKATGSKMHPGFVVRDVTGANALKNGESADPLTTCGECHDSRFIQKSSSHWSHTVSATCFDCHVPRVDDWTADGTDEEGRLRFGETGVKRADEKSCIPCHGLGMAPGEPVTLPEDYLHPKEGRRYDLTQSTGVIYAGTRISDSYLNIAGRDELHVPFDVHAKRLVGCTSCHHAANNPARAGLKKASITHLKRDPRLPGISEYIRRPDHDLAAASCESCHDARVVHGFLPYRNRHLAVLDCQSCHVPKVYGPVLSFVDETVLRKDGSPVTGLRNIESGDGPLGGRAIEGLEPFLLSYLDESGEPRIGPFNLVAHWYWVDEKTGKKLSPEVVRSAWMDGTDWRPAVKKAFDRNGDGVLSDGELYLQSDGDVAVIRDALKAVGVHRPTIRGEVEAYPVAHGVTEGDAVLRQCEDCHGADSRLTGSISVGDRMPGGVSPKTGERLSGVGDGRLQFDKESGIRFERDPEFEKLYVFGLSKVRWSDLAGLLIFAFAAFGISVHGGYRFYTRKRRTPHTGPTRKVYMYTVYERIWHWLMAASVIALLFTGFAIHYPDQLGASGFGTSVTVHNYVAIILVLNAFLSLFYHVTSAAITQFIPDRDGLVSALLAQVRYYSQGIFLGHAHPSEKTADRKLNPLQQLTYLGLLNVLFPLQVLTGLAIWATYQWPALSSSIGWLRIIGPVHNMGSWLFLTFLVVHLYLTTTGRTLTSNIVAMVDGFDEEDVDDVDDVGHGGDDLPDGAMEVENA